MAKVEKMSSAKVAEGEKKPWDGYIHKACPKCGATDYKEVDCSDNSAGIIADRLECNVCGHIGPPNII